MIKCVLFDMDGVLIDSEYGAFDFMRKTLNMQGVNISTEELLKYIGMTSLNIADELCRKYGLPMTGEELQRRNRENGNYYSDSDELQLIPGAEEFIQYLKNCGVLIGLVSSTGSKNVMTVLNRLRIMKYFDTVICGDMLKKVKPEPDPYIQAAELLSVKPSECVVIEDSAAGINAGLAAGMLVIGFTGSSIVQNVSKADYTADNFGKVKQIFEKLRLSGINESVFKQDYQ